MSTGPNEVAVIGAGVAGLAAARRLLASGHRVRVIDKGRGVGGRLATRRIGGARLDHGAQFFTVRSSEFRADIDAAINDGIVDIWTRGFDGDDGHPRYYCPDGMTALAKWWAAEVERAGGRIEVGLRATAVSPADGRWTIELDRTEPLRADHVVLSSPVPQSLDLLDAGSVSLPGPHDQLRNMTYDPTIALLVTLTGPSAVPPPGGQQTPSEVFSFIADNRVKGISKTTALTFHVTAARSEALWDRPDDEVTNTLLDLAQPWLGASAIDAVQLKKWRYATPRHPHPERCVTVASDPGMVVLSGDAFGGPKVEGAFLSGRSAADAISSRAPVDPQR